jgi:hypothetical protein
VARNVPKRGSRWRPPSRYRLLTKIRFRLLTTQTPRRRKHRDNLSYARRVSRAPHYAAKSPLAPRTSSNSILRLRKLWDLTLLIERTLPRFSPSFRSLDVDSMQCADYPFPQCRSGWSGPEYHRPQNKKNPFSPSLPQF